METVKKLRDLWRHRRYVAGVCVVAVLAGMLVAYQPSFPPKSKSYDVGVATAQVLVDTQDSQVVGVSSAVNAQAGQVLGTLGTQANLLADLMVEGPIKADIAQRAGLKPDQLTGVSAAVSVPSAAGSSSGSGPSSVSVPSGPNVYALTTQILTDTAGQTTFPIIEIDAQAPDPAKAVRLATAAVAGLQAFVSSKAADERIPNADRLNITNFGVSQATTQAQGPSPMIGIIVTLVVLVLGCVSILWILAVIRGWRRASERERLGLGEPLEDEAEWVPNEMASPVDTAPGPAVAPNRLFLRPPGPAVAPNRLLLRPHFPTNGVSHFPTNGRPRPHFPANGVSGSPDHGGPAPADAPSSTEDSSGQRPASSARHWSSRRWSSRQI